MGRKKSSGGRKGKPKARKESPPTSLTPLSGFIRESAPGCFSWAGGDSDWLLGPPQRFSRSEFGLSRSDHVPDLSLDPEERTLSVINSSPSVPRAYHISLEHPVYGRGGMPLPMGRSRAENGDETPCVAFALLVPPSTMCEVCVVDLGGAEAETVSLSSDIVDWHPHPRPQDLTRATIFDTFPLVGEPDSFLCSQGCGGGLTHFSHPSTWMALDFDCPLGTPVVALGAGLVADVKQSCTVGGCHVKHLFQWNAITLHLDLPVDELLLAAEETGDDAGCSGSGAEDEGAWESDGDDGTTGSSPESSKKTLVVEYVHIQAGSATVSVGDRVFEGQVICLSGDVGFCPGPHLHIQAHWSAAPGAESIPMGWRGPDGVYFPSPGSRYPLGP